MTTEENKALIRRFIEETINAGNVAAADELVAVDFVELDPLPGQAQGREGLKHVLTMLLAAFPDLHWRIDEQVAEGDKVVTRCTWQGTHQGAFLGIPATGKPVDFPVMVIDRVAGGKMTDSRLLIDRLAMLQQLGVIPADQGQN